MHTKYGNTFGSAYKPIGRVTQTFQEGVYGYIWNTVTINQTLTTTYYG